ncbi:Acetoin dehydrogenase operon transcriptional activator AcoR [Nocardioides dokdonensis FR1436]|uniref:Acetoin dehydrogenase operon transcriptional activator AcoR n=1 Tax=Nocardioides dokdonensis FR1436 TaxID=1300347 RepID=A0A1A9GHH3_9ACTN|nr:helix-turn-helix domain-containing protein [Nocardioides dokdonensis]ANH36971.1 Acetoin dehydrogenase operon transcriptional activator AcoR [Nocardioides dokdonensis FR1436]
MGTASSDLHSRRVDAVRAWTSFVEEGDDARARVRPEILTSWTRSGATVSPDVREAPLADESETAAFWSDSPLQTAVERVESDLRRTAEDGDLVVAVTDPQTRVLWTYGGRVMRREAEAVNFVPGGRWDDESVGTNALDLANRHGAPATVFSAEHYASIVHDWVCWAAPVRDPATGVQLGVLDLSTTWDRTHPIGLATARVLARLIEQALPATAHPLGATADETGDPGLVMTLLGQAETRFDGQRLLLSRRQTEILALLALHPQGLSLDQLHAMVYGEQTVTFSTLKAEVSHLRHALGGQLSSRPYRLQMPVHTDVDHVLSLLRRGFVGAAVDAYGGDLLPGTDSPALQEMGEYVAVSVRESLLARPDPDAVARYSELAPYDTEVVEACLASPGTLAHPVAPLLKGRLAAARR